jgi:A/G-specific adenine glycosylase
MATNSSKRGGHPTSGPAALPPELVPELLDWYDAHRRKMPWREQSTPYRVWISEIMLQQTRVETVIPYFERFMEKLPDIAALAAADEETLLKLWEGLGYYRRVRHLHQAARLIADAHGGIFPSDHAAILNLPGIGAYTAGAIASIAFGQPVPAVDGNVLRVLARLTGATDDIAAPPVKVRFTGLLQAIYPAGRPGDFTQSLMELGALVCLPNGEPKCADCPWHDRCFARRHGCTATLPVKAPPRPRRVVERTVLLLCRLDAVALVKRPAHGLLAGLWEFPTLEGKMEPDAVRRHLEKEGIAITGDVRVLGEAAHIFSHLEWHMTGFRVECASRLPGCQWATPLEIEKVYPLPTALKAFVRRWLAGT